MKVSYSKSLHNKSRCLNTMKSFLTFKIINTRVFLYFQKVLSLKLGRTPSSIRTAILFCFICTAWRGEYLTIIPRARMDYWCVSLLLNVFYRSLNVNLRLLIGKLVRKMNSNRFISCLVDQKLIRIIRISALTFMSSTVSFDLIFFITLCYFLNCEEVLPEFCIDIDVFFLWVFYWSFVCSFLKDFKKVFWHIDYYYYYYYYYYCYYNFYYYYYYYFRLTPSSTAIARILEEEVVLSGYLVPAQVSLSTWPLHIQKCDYAHLFLTNAFVYHQSRRRSVFQGCTCVPRTTNPLMCRIRNTHGKKLSILH